MIMYMYTVNEQVIKGLKHIAELSTFVEKGNMTEREYYLSVRAILVTLGELKMTDNGEEIVNEPEPIKEKKPLVMPDEEFPELEMVSEERRPENNFKKLIENIRTWRK